MNKCKFLDNAFRPPDPKKVVLHQLEEAARCAIDGTPIAEGYMVSELVTSATNQPHEIFKFNSEHASAEAGRLFKSMRGPASMLGNLIALPSGGLKPMVSRDSATKAERPCWHDLVLNLEVGQPCVAVFTEEAKRRFWINAPLAFTGPDWRPYLHWRSVSRVLSVDLAHLQHVLRRVAFVYSSGFSKNAILTNLLENYKTAQEIGFQQTTQMEAELNQWRGSDEYWLAAFMCQKEKL